MKQQLEFENLRHTSKEVVRLLIVEKELSALAAEFVLRHAIDCIQDIQIENYREAVKAQKDRQQ